MKKWTDQKIENMLRKMKNESVFEEEADIDMKKSKEEIWKKIKTEIEVEENQEKIKRIRRVHIIKHYSLVASLLLVIGVGAYIPFNKQESKMDNAENKMVATMDKEADIASIANGDGKTDQGQMSIMGDQKEDIVLNDEFYLEKKQQIENEVWYYYHHKNEQYIFIVREAFGENEYWKKEKNGLTYWYDEENKVLYINDTKKNKGIYIEKKIDGKQIEDILSSFVIVN